VIDLAQTPQELARLATGACGDIKVLIDVNT
jgi:hypothetical protein